jgi:hypothetical protein
MMHTTCGRFPHPPGEHDRRPAGFYGCRRLCLRAPWRCRRNDLPGQRKSARDDDELSVPGPAHSEDLVISFLKCSQDVSHCRATFCLRRAPANDNALADVGSCEVNRQSIAHAHLSWELQRRPVRSTLPEQQLPAYEERVLERRAMGRHIG